MDLHKETHNHWTLSQLVNRRDLLVKDGIRFKNGLHEQVSIVYPSYHKFFSEIDGKSAMYFWKTYPSPLHLQGKTAKELTEEIREISRIFKKSKPGIGTAFASKLIAEIGDIRRFRNADKLARYAGVAPVKFSSAGKGKEQIVPNQLQEEQ